MIPISTLDHNCTMGSRADQRWAKWQRARFISAVDQNGTRSAIDCMITRVKAKVAGERAAARSGEDGKWSKYEKFLQRCAPEDPSDPRLQTEIIPFVVETHGAAGPEACRLMAITKHQFGRLVLPCEDRSAEQVFYAAWAYRVSTAVQRGTALMIHNIVLGNSTKSRRTKDVDVEPGSDGGDEEGASPTRSNNAGGSSSEVEATDSEHSGESGTEVESDREPEPEPQPAAAPGLVPSQVVVKGGHSTAAGATKARR